jgi:ubiquinone/menaquinone biosynthesis C-methylase UbiE
MAKNWKDAQIHEQTFWKNIYINSTNDDIYNKTNALGWYNFAKHILDRNKIKLDELNNKMILDLGCGPGGVAKGLHEMLIKKDIIKSKIIAVDPLMDFYKNEINLLKEDENLKLLTNKGESLNLKDNSIDIIFSTNVLDHCDDAEKVISECYRVLKPNGIFFPSLHLVYDYLTIVSPFIKYFDTNHPHHFTRNSILKKFYIKFYEVDEVERYTIKNDQNNFTFFNIFKSKDLFRGFKRYLSNFVLYTCYFKCVKKK